MSSIKDVIEVDITRETASVSVQSFGVPLIVTTQALCAAPPNFSRTAEYAGLSEMLAAGWTAADAGYKAAQAIFAQNPKVAKVVVGWALDSDASPAATMEAILASDSEWYGVILAIWAADVSDATKKTAVLAYAAWVEAQGNRILFVRGSDAGMVDSSSTTDLAYSLKALGYDRSVVLYHVLPLDDASASVDDFAEAAWMGEGFPYDPGTSTWAYKVLSGVVADAITAAQAAALKVKNANWYSSIAGTSVTQWGMVASGEWIDIIIGIDWITAHIQSEIYAAQLKNRKIPYTDPGIQVMQGIVSKVLQTAVGMGILVENSVVVTVPAAADCSASDKAARSLRNVKFTADLAGAIHHTKISGTVAY